MVFLRFVPGFYKQTSILPKLPRGLAGALAASHSQLTALNICTCVHTCLFYGLRSYRRCIYIVIGYKGFRVTGHNHQECPQAAKVSRGEICFGHAGTRVTRSFTTLPRSLQALASDLREGVLSQIFPSLPGETA